MIFDLFYFETDHKMTPKSFLAIKPFCNIIIKVEESTSG
jgi:hypothetical protein